jgi:DNA mismatch repair protein PMS2
MSSRINRLERGDILRICSGQVITDLSSAVKELVENSLDAGSNSIEVKFRNFGLDGFEVSDNGEGISSFEYDHIVMKSHTSKIRTFDDIYDVNTYGFRGEALSSIAEISSSLQILTRTKADETATIIEYNKSGKVVSSNVSSRDVGTTVIVTGLFSALPVRYRDFQTNIKKQYTSAIQLLQTYALISEGVKIQVIHTSKSEPHDSNHKRAKNVLDDDFMPDSSENYPQSFHTGPSKRTIVMSSSGGTLRDSILDLFGSKFLSSLIPVSFTLPDPIGSRASETNLVEEDSSTSESKQDRIGPLKTPSVSASVSGFVSAVGTGIGRQNNEKQFIYINGRPVDFPKCIRLVNEVWRLFEMNHKPAVILNFHLPSNSFDINVSPNKRAIFLSKEDDILNALKQCFFDLWEPSRRAYSSSDHTKVVGNLTQQVLNFPSSSSNKDDSASASTEERMKISSKKDDQAKSLSSEAEGTDQTLVSREKETDDTENDEIVVSEKDEPILDLVPLPSPNSSVVSPTQLDEPNVSENVSMSKSFIYAESPIFQMDSSHYSSTPLSSSYMQYSNEQTLLKTLHKHDFRTMADPNNILGQFNVGFIITKLDGDLFILDQHACDEKAKFESFKANTFAALKPQALVHPLKLELTSSEEIILLDHVSVFERHGFRFSTRSTSSSDTASVGRVNGIYLTAHFQSKGITFGVDDIQELCSILADIPKNSPLLQSVVLPKAINMFASRACRSAVMIGDPLKRDTIKRIVSSLATLDQPWNCPHGRPTLRHLLDLSSLHHATLESVVLPGPNVSDE